MGLYFLYWILTDIKHQLPLTEYILHNQKEKNTGEINK